MTRMQFLGAVLAVTAMRAVAGRALLQDTLGEVGSFQNVPLGSNSLQVPTYVYSLQGPAIARGLTPSGDLLLAFAPDTAPAAAPSLDIPATGRKLLAQKSTAPVPAPAQYTPVLAPACAISAGSAPVVAPIQVVDTPVPAPAQCQPLASLLQQAPLQQYGSLVKAAGLLPELEQLDYFTLLVPNDAAIASALASAPSSLQSSLGNKAIMQQVAGQNLVLRSLQPSKLVDGETLDTLQSDSPLTVHLDGQNVTLAAPNGSEAKVLAAIPSCTGEIFVTDNLLFASSVVAG